MLKWCHLWWNDVKFHFHSMHSFVGSQMKVKLWAIYHLSVQSAFSFPRNNNLNSKSVWNTQFTRVVWPSPRGQQNWSPSQIIIPKKFITTCKPEVVTGMARLRISTSERYMTDPARANNRLSPWQSAACDLLNPETGKVSNHLSQCSVVGKIRLIYQQIFHSNNSHAPL